MTTLANIFGGIGMAEMIVLALLGLLIFGKRLPEVGKNLGKGIVEFKKGLAGVEEDVTKPTALPRNEAPREIDPTLTSSRSSVEELQAENARLRAQLSDKSQHSRVILTNRVVPIKPAAAGYRSSWHQRCRLYEKNY